MSEFKGSKGPWETNDKRPQCGGFSIFSGSQYLAFVGDSDHKTNCEANANLIAAAPELLEALNIAVGYLSQEVDHQSSLFISVIDQCNEAIDKALGVK